MLSVHWRIKQNSVFSYYSVIIKQRLELTRWILIKPPPELACEFSTTCSSPVYVMIVKLQNIIAKERLGKIYIYLRHQTSRQPDIQSSR